MAGLSVLHTAGLVVASIYLGIVIEKEKHGVDIFGIVQIAASVAFNLLEYISKYITNTI